MGQLEPNISARCSEHQMRWWNILHAPKQETASPYRFLTISRDEGTLGDEIAKVLSEHLGWHLYDKEIVNIIAAHNHVRENMVWPLDEKINGLMHNMISRMLPMPEGAPFGFEEYHESLLKALAGLANRGNAILVGRGANFALRWFDQGLHVRITGSLDARVQRLSKSWHVPHEAARRRIVSTDEDRRVFIQHHFRQDINDPRSYSIVINTDHVSVNQVVVSLMAILHA